RIAKGFSDASEKRCTPGRFADASTSTLLRSVAKPAVLHPWANRSKRGAVNFRHADYPEEGDPVSSSCVRPPKEKESPCPDLVVPSACSPACCCPAAALLVPWTPTSNDSSKPVSAATAPRCWHSSGSALRGSGRMKSMLSSGN